MDFVILEDLIVDEIEFIFKGGDGGFVMLINNCKFDGGEGVMVIVCFKIGEGVDVIFRGVMLCFVVGRVGEKGIGNNVLFIGLIYGGGGGGIGLLYKEFEDFLWIIVVVVGGGGGVY